MTREEGKAVWAAMKRHLPHLAWQVQQEKRRARAEAYARDVLRDMYGLRWDL